MHTNDSGRHGGTQAGKKVDHGKAPTCHSGGGALGNLAAIEGGAPQAVAAVGVGECVVERVYASMEEVGPTMCSVWIHTPRNGADTACAVWGMEDAVPERVGENLGTPGANGPAVALS